jgi:hypothetical protein
MSSMLRRSHHDDNPGYSGIAGQMLFPMPSPCTPVRVEGQMFVLYAADYLCNRHAHLYENF